MPPLEFLKKVRDTKKERMKDFLGTLLNQHLEPSFAPIACACPSFSKMTKSLDTSRPGISQEGHNTPPDNIPTSVRIMQTHIQPRKQQKQKRVDMESNWNDSDDGKDNQVR